MTDGFAIARERAREIHARFAGSGGDALGPSAPALVERVAGDRGYDLIPLRADDSLLLDACAVLDRGVRAIFFRGDSSVTDAALFVAHELGHLLLHDERSDRADRGDQRCSSHDLEIADGDDTDNVGGGSGGVHRVSAYSARERQELQANVFARELLLPRHLARTLFLEQELGATAIAKALGIPLEAVRQQLCDAVMLPDPVSAASEETDEPDDHAADALSLDASQRAAVEHMGSPLLLEAGPGTGKTRTLIGRIVHLVSTGVDPASIVALTFSNKAAREIAERVAESLPSAAASLWTGTFHAFGLELLRKHHDAARLPADFRVLDRADVIELLEASLPRLELEHYQNLYEPALQLRDISGAISRAKDELKTPEDYRRLAQAMADEPTQDDASRLAAAKAQEVARAYDVYQQLLEAKGAVDFGDLIALPVRLLRDQPALRASLRLRYRHLLIDEYQDVNRASAEFLKQLAGRGERLWAVGDTRQSIYRFRGASSLNMTHFGDDFPRAERKALAVNYRSTAEIVDAFSAFGRSFSEGFSEGLSVAAKSLPLDLRASAGASGHPPQLVQLDYQREQVAAVAQGIDELRASGVDLGQQAVLCRTHRQLETVADELAARGIPTLHVGSLFERDEVRDALCVLSLLVEPAGGAVLRLAAMPEYAIPLQDVYRLFEPEETTSEDADEGADEGEPRRPPPPMIDRLSQLDDVDGLSDGGRLGLERLREDMNGLEPAMSAWQILASYFFDRGSSDRGGLDRGGVLRRLASSQRMDDRLRLVALYQFLAWSRGRRLGGRGWPARRLLDRVRRLVLLGDERDLRQLPGSALSFDAVRLLTLHGSKGLEFEAVHIPGWVKGGLPASFRASRCPPPPGLIEGYMDGSAGDEAGDGRDIERRIHARDEECLAFVGLSRARRHLRLYVPSRDDHRRRTPSPFLDPLRPLLLSIDSRAVEPTHSDPLPSAAVRAVVIHGLEPLVLDRGDLELYDRCPRRYFYSRVLRLPGSRRRGAFVDTHRAIYAVLDWLRESDAQVDQIWSVFEQAWQRVGPVDHAFAAHYRQLAESLIGRLAELHADGEASQTESQALELTIGQALWRVEPDLASTLADGTERLRFVRTGRAGSFTADDITHALIQEAARARFGTGGARLEVVHLSDGGQTPILLSQRKVATRLEKVEAYVAAIREGRFPADPEARKCPRCPYFFVCDAVPSGPLTLKRPTDAPG